MDYDKVINILKFIVIISLGIMMGIMLFYLGCIIRICCENLILMIENRCFGG